jgi:signal transduction histidine kinase
MGMRWSAGQLAAAGSVLVVFGAAVWTEQSIWLDHPVQAIGYGSVGIGFAVTALLLRAEAGQRQNVYLLVVLTVIWLLNQAGHEPIGLLSAPAYFLGSFVQTLVAALLLRYPDTRFDTLPLWFVRVNLPIAAFFGAVQPLVGSPEWSNLNPNGVWPNVWQSAAVSDAVALARAIWLSMAGSLFIMLLVRRWLRLNALERRTLSPILVAGSFAAVMVAADPARWVASGRFADVLVSVRAFSGAELAAAFVFSAVRLRLARSGLTTLIFRLSGALTVEGVRDALREALSDPRLEINYWVADRRAFVTGAGTVPVPPADGEERMVVHVRSSDGGPLAAVITDPGLRRHQELVDSAVAVSGLALENARLQAGRRAHLAAVQEARRRLLSVGLDERRRLERDLHDGAQQRLLAIAMRLGAIEARGLDDHLATEVGRARAELGMALEDLRRLAHGIYPAVLTQSGLGPAIEAVAERLPVPIIIDVPARRWSEEVESTAYFVVCEALSNVVKHASALTALVQADVRSPAGAGPVLEIEITDDGVGSAALGGPASLMHLRDRLAAVGGELSVVSRVGVGTDVVASIPCG